MKKLSAIIAMVVCLTIGGVYATWTYAGTDDIADAFAEAKVTIADTELTGANGTYKIESNLALVVDQKNEQHEAELLFKSNNDQPVYLKITFTPSVNAPEKIKNEAVPSQLYFGVTTPMQYKIDTEGNYSETGTPTDIFTFSNVSDNKLDVVWVDAGDGTFTYTLNGTQLQGMISLSRTFVLDTKAEHDAFRAALAGNIVARVTDGTVNAQ